MKKLAAYTAQITISAGGDGRLDVPSAADLETILSVGLTTRLAKQQGGIDHARIDVTVEVERTDDEVGE